MVYPYAASIILTLNINGVATNYTVLSSTLTTAVQEQIYTTLNSLIQDKIEAVKNTGIIKLLLKLV